MNIMDGMDAARFTSGNPDLEAGKKRESKQEKDKSKMPQVLRNLNNR